MVQNLLGWIPELVITHPIPVAVVAFAVSWFLMHTAGSSDPRAS
jgi:hypothetical protein